MDRSISLENQVAIVTGAAGGLGCELVKILADAGACVALADTVNCPKSLIPQVGTFLFKNAMSPKNAIFCISSTARTKNSGRSMC
jgi:hypothetical protein